ncbi:hypothetical protein Gotri_020703, partial [Gossypium trilobum]|nr:hypothetical protein [Gossypium trilobum]
KTTQVGGFLGVRNLAVDFKNHVSFQFINCIVGSFEKSEDIGGCKELLMSWGSL